jgi:hypothetical protein
MTSRAGMETRPHGVTETKKKNLANNKNAMPVKPP